MFFCLEKYVKKNKDIHHRFDYSNHFLCFNRQFIICCPESAKKFFEQHIWFKKYIVMNQCIPVLKKIIKQLLFNYILQAYLFNENNIFMIVLISILSSVKTYISDLIICLRVHFIWQQLLINYPSLCQIRTVSLWVNMPENSML